MCHEIGHMFGINHCIHYNCIMNGSNSLKESDRQSTFLCPICLRKLHFAVYGFNPNFDILARYRKMAEFWAEHGQEVEVDWLRRRIDKLSA